MMFRPSHVVAGALALMGAACSDNDNLVRVPNVASVRLVNDTDTPISFTNPNVLGSMVTTLVFGQSSCMLVDLSTATVPFLDITNGGTGASITVSPNLSAGDNLSVVFFVGAGGNVQVATLNNHFIPATTAAGLRFFNGVANTAPLLMQRNAAAITPFVGFGSASDFVSVPIDSGRVTFSDQSSVVLDAGLMAFPQGMNSTVVLGPPAPETVPLRFFTVQGC